MNLRVIERDGKYYVQKKIGIIFKQWEYLREDMMLIDYEHDWEDAEPYSTEDKGEAIDFMERVYTGKYPQDHYKVIAWIGDKE